MSDRDISPRDVYVRGESRSRSRSDREEGRTRDSGKRGGEHRERRERRTSRSRSPMGSRYGAENGKTERDRPQPSRCVGVFGLSIYTNERELREFFSKYGSVEDVQVVYDAQTGRSRGFGFVYFDTEDDANEAKEKANGLDIDGRKIRVDFSITKRAHTPTPGVYMGRPTRRPNRRGGGGSHSGGGGGDRDGYYRSERGSSRDRRGDRGGYDSYSRGRRYTRSPSPYSRRDHRSDRDRYRERERSYSPRRYY